MAETDQAEQREATQDAHMADKRPYPGTPRWVKMLGIILVSTALLFAVLHLTNSGMGPGMHMPQQGTHQP